MRFGIFLFLLLMKFELLAQNPAAHSGSLPDSNGVYTFVEQYPKYPGGDGALMGFIQRNLQWPNVDSTDLDYLNSKILTRFVVDTDGSITNITCLRPQNAALKKEVIRVLKLMPKFQPGLQNGKAVKVYFNLPIIIELR